MPDTRARDRELSVWQAELAEVDRAIERHESFKAQTFVFGTGGVIVLIGSAFESGGAAGTAARPLVLLLVTFVCAFLGMFLVDRDEAILALLQYREGIIKPRVRALVGADDVLGSYEFFNREAYGRNRSLSRKFAHRLTAPFPHALFYVAGAASFAYLLYLRLGSESLDGAGWALALAAAGFALLYAWTGAFLTGGQWAQVGSPPTERGIPFMRRRIRARLPQPDGWSPGDSHAHTNWSDGWRSVWSQAEWAARRSLEWLILTDHTDGLGEDWCGYVAAIDEVGRRLGTVTLLPGAEVTVVDRPGGVAQGDVLVYGWPLESEPPPTNRVSTARTLLPRIAERGAVATIAHPYGGGAPLNRGLRGTKLGAPAWRDWNAGEVAAVELLSFEYQASPKTVDRWFGLLEQSLDGDAPTWAIAGTDSHMPWNAPGSRGMTWIRHDAAGRPDSAAVLAALRSGRAVASGRGDFGTLLVNGAGPGERVGCEPAMPVAVSCVQRAARGRRCVRVELLSRRVTAADGTRQPSVLVSADGPFEPTFELRLTGAAKAGFVVAHFVFAEGARGARRVADVWTNPVFIGE